MGMDMGRASNYTPSALVECNNVILPKQGIIFIHPVPSKMRRASTVWALIPIICSFLLHDKLFKGKTRRLSRSVWQPCLIVLSFVWQSCCDVPSGAPGRRPALLCD